jgi:hypothetical protein
MIPFLSATNCSIMLSDRFTKYLYYIMIFNVMDIIFGMTSEKIVNQKENPILRECAIIYIQTQFVFDLLIVFSFSMMIFFFRADIIMHILDVEFSDGTIGNTSFDEKKLKWKIKCVHILMYLTLFKLKQENAPFTYQVFEEFSETCVKLFKTDQETV